MSGRTDFDAGDLAERYDRGRALPRDTLEQWMDEVARCWPEGAARVLDLGCGTGRFTAPLAERFGARVYGLDRSAKMLAVARSRGTEGVALVRGDGGAIPFHDGAFDVVFASMVLHHLVPEAGLREVIRVLRAGGKLMVRAGSVENMESYLWLRFFPEAAAVEASRLMTRGAMRRLLKGAGLVRETERTVRQVLASDLTEYRERVGQRTFSSLAAISDQAFAAGMAALSDYVTGAAEDGAVAEEVDFLVYRR